MPNKSIEEMSRPEVIEELRRYAPARSFQGLLKWNTAHLKAILAYWKEEEKNPVQFAVKTIPFIRSFIPSAAC